MNEHTLERNEAKRQTSRGRNATRPSEIPPRGWKDIGIRVKNEIAADNLSIIAAGVAFYAFLSIFPALAAFVSIYGLITDPAELQQHVSSIQTLFPAEAAQLVNDELRRVGESQESHLGWSLVVGTLLAIWSAAKGMKTMFESMNVAYDEKESRGFFKLNAAAVLMTLGAILFVIAFLTLIVGVPAYLASFGMPGILGSLINYLRWPILAVAGIFALSFLYRYGPSRRKPQWRWISWGAAIGTFIWLLGSGLFSFYVANFNNYNKTYGSLGVVVILMMWLLLSVYSVLIGAEVNAEMEHQTAEDTTVGQARTMGQRGAHVADTVGEES